MACQAELIRSLGRARLVLMLIKLPLLFTASSSRESEIRAVGRKHFADGPINNSISVCYDVGRPKFEILRWAGSNDWRSSFPAESLGGPNVGGTSTSQDQPSISFRKNISFKCFGEKQPSVLSPFQGARIHGCSLADRRPKADMLGLDL